VAWCIDSQGRRHLLQLAVVNKESEACWTEFFRHMLGRGMRAPSTPPGDRCPSSPAMIDNPSGFARSRSRRSREVRACPQASSGCPQLSTGILNNVVQPVCAASRCARCPTKRPSVDYQPRRSVRRNPLCPPTLTPPVNKTWKRGRWRALRFDLCPRSCPRTPVVHRRSETPASELPAVLEIQAYSSSVNSSTQIRPVCVRVAPGAP
jgi:hypothetical protein